MNYSMIQAHSMDFHMSCITTRYIHYVHKLHMLYDVISLNIQWVYIKVLTMGYILHIPYILKVSYFIHYVGNLFIKVIDCSEPSMRLK